jgi:hypothetical protein
MQGEKAMRGGIWVLNIFAAVWVCAGIWLGDAPQWLMVVPIALSAAILWRASGMTWRAVEPERQKRIGRVVGIWSGVEGVAMFVTANVLINLHLRDAIMPAFAIIVGAHFLPLARGIPMRIYYATGAALIVVGAIALLAPPFHPLLATGLVAGVILWVSAILLIRIAR